MKHKPVSVPKYSVLFCRYGVAILLWCALFFRSDILLIATFLIFLFSGLLGINKAPMVVLFSNTIGRLINKQPVVILDINDIRFIHYLAASINFIILALMYFTAYRAAFVVLFGFCILKTLSALGYCPASKLRSCVLGGGKGTCCSTTNIFKRNKTC